MGSWDPCRRYNLIPETMRTRSNAVPVSQQQGPGDILIAWLMLDSLLPFNPVPSLNMALTLNLTIDDFDPLIGERC